MTDRNDPDHDQAFKLRPVFKHFNGFFSAAIELTKFESINKHAIRFKRRSIMKQYVKRKPIQWGFKMWCRCNSNSKYLFEFDWYTGKKHGGAECGLGEGVLLAHTEKLEGLKKIRVKYTLTTILILPCYGPLFISKNFNVGTVHINRKMFPNKN